MMIRRIAAAMLLAAFATPALAADPDAAYKPGPDAQRKQGVPQGKVTQHTLASTKVYPGTERDYWVYVPAQYDGKTPAAVMVFQDGHAYVNEKGDIRAPIVFDNLIAAGEMPVTIGIFINPGNDPKKNPLGEGDKKRTGWNIKPTNRSIEYDTLSGEYAKFLLEEVLPEVAKSYKLTDDPNLRAICGMSSGGICAFTVAWERPDAFRKVVSHIGSFTDIRGGHNYMPLIRKTPPKPLRIFLQDGKNDLDNQHGNWFLANLDIEKSILFANRTADEKAKAGQKVTADRYDLKTVWGDGAHNGKHGGAIFPDTMRWLWR
jgi:enterochelin esterase family protein